MAPHVALLRRKEFSLAAPASYYAVAHRKSEVKLLDP